MSRVKLAFVIPFYKIDFFEDTLQALSRQTNQDFSVYIGNDASKSNPQDLINQYNNGKIVYKRFPENLGAKDLEGQWKRCIDLISNDEEWICILADDDFPKDNFVEEFYHVLPEVEKRNINVIKAAITSVDSQSKIRGGDLVHPVLESSINTFWRDRNEETYTSISENIFRKSCYNSIGFRGFPLAWGTPLIAWIDYTKGGEIFGMNNTQMCVRVSEINLSRTDSFKDQKQEGEAMVYEIIFRDYSKFFTQKQKYFLLKKYHAVLHYYKRKNKLPESILSLYGKYGGPKGIFFYIFREMKWRILP